MHSARRRTTQEKQPIGLNFAHRGPNKPSHSGQVDRYTIPYEDVYDEAHSPPIGVRAILPSSPQLRPLIVQQLSTDVHAPCLTCPAGAPAPPPRLPACMSRRPLVCARRPCLAFGRSATPAPPPLRLREARRSAAAAAAAAERALHACARSKTLKYLVAGALAGVVSRTVVSPLEVVATVNMCGSGATRPLLEELRVLFAAEGMRGFFKGNAANCLKVAPTKGIQFVMFEAFKRLFGRRRVERGGDVRIGPGERLFAGGAAGMAAAVACYPLEVAKTLLTAHPERYRSVFGTLAEVGRSSGVRGLYRGLAPTLVAMFPYVGLEFMVYEQLKLMYERRAGREADVVRMLIIGAVAGSLAQTTCHPLDVVRKRLQLQGIGGRPVQYKGMLEAGLRIWKNEGPKALYRGLQPMYVSAVPSAGVSYAVYESMKTALGVESFR